jgi:hypothetical protein
VLEPENLGKFERSVSVAKDDAAGSVVRPLVGVLGAPRAIEMSERGSSGNSAFSVSIHAIINL